MAQFIYRLQSARPEMLSLCPTADEEAVMAEHFEYLMRLAGSGSMILAGRTLNTDRSSFGIVILECDNEEKARELMLDDPGVREGVFLSELFPFRIAVTPRPPCSGNRQ